MGVTIATCKKSVDLTYSGMYRFRKELAKLYSKELGEHYAELEKSDIDYDAHDKETERLWNQYDDDGKCFINFLYQSDCDGKISFQEVRRIYKRMKKVDIKGHNFGYGVRPVDFSDIAEVFKDSAKNRHVIKWY